MYLIIKYLVFLYHQISVTFMKISIFPIPTKIILIPSRSKMFRKLSVINGCILPITQYNKICLLRIYHI